MQWSICTYTCCVQTFIWACAFNALCIVICFKLEFCIGVWLKSKNMCQCLHAIFKSRHQRVCHPMTWKRLQLFEGVTLQCGFIKGWNKVQSGRYMNYVYCAYTILWKVKTHVNVYTQFQNLNAKEKLWNFLNEWRCNEAIPQMVEQRSIWNVTKHAKKMRKIF